MSVKELMTPLSEEKVRELRVRDVLYLTGTIFTARDRAHERSLEWLKNGKKQPVDYSGMVMFHCGPLVQKIGNEWKVLAAGPTTSARMEELEGPFIDAFKVRMIIGKGGMGSKTSASMKKNGAVYCTFTGGAAVLAARAVKSIVKVKWLDLGMAEAIWVMEVEKFGPLTVTIDSTGNNLHDEIMKDVQSNRIKLKKKFGF